MQHPATTSPPIRPLGGARQRSRSGDGGQALPLVAAVLVLAAVVLVALVPLARGAHDRATARAAADAAALAGAAEGREAAREVAAANRAELVDYLEVGDDVLVVVTVGAARAEARARREAWSP